MEPFYLGMWLFSGAIGLGIGQRSKRPLAGFLWGFFLGPIGWIVMLAAGSGK